MEATPKTNASMIANPTTVEVTLASHVTLEKMVLVIPMSLLYMGGASRPLLVPATKG